MALSEGTVIDARYRLVRQIAVGGMGEVWEAADTRLGRPVAVKVLKAELSHDQEFLHRFRIEARTTASINHAGIAAVHDYGEADAGGGKRTAYLVMELVEGEPLSARLANRKRLTPDRTLDVLEQAGRALQAAHDRGFVHRDVKPGNILLMPDGRVKLTDFGIAKAANAVPMTRGGMVMGTAQYIAPEQAMGGDASPTGDVYSLGIVGYECLAGRRPFNAENPVDVAMMQIRDAPAPLPSSVPAQVRKLIETALVKDPKLRYASGGEFADAAAAVRAGQPAPAPLTKPAAASGGTAGGKAAAKSASKAGAKGGAAAAATTKSTTTSTAQLAPAVGSTRAARRAARSGSAGRGVLLTLFALLTAAALVVGAVVVSSALGRGAEGPSAVVSTPAPASTAPPANTVQISPSAFTGRSASTVSAEIREMGLRTNVLTTRGRTPVKPANCRVITVTPSGAVAKGSVVTVSCEETAR